MIALREQSEPLTVDEARDTIMVLFGELVLGAGEAEREKRRLSRAEIVGAQPILFANARDAHQRAGHRFRAGWYESRFYWKRRRLMKRGLRQLGQGKVASSRGKL